uniref:endogenous retrovirus group K member 5 Gag polyprotein-like n=1 Tax=Agelaius phoeniceus TaxID=39638 RepID=UPI0023ED00EE|nr:endogenous retrovirus group K member 5 Gag polyprotein-like [Agelaius phoeniceus]XP_054506979.1 endogenous retrovirus group K member 5 Gag polyprotein-like [Agelaius phoeniceus]
MEFPEEEEERPIEPIDWKEIRNELSKEKGLIRGSGDIIMPVTYDAQGQNPRWESLGHEVIKDLSKAIQNNGLNSQFLKQLLKGTFNTYDFTPFDIRCLVSMILTDTQSLIWDRRWRRYLTELRASYQGGPNANLTESQLAGDPPDDSPVEQAARLPRQVLNDIKEAAHKEILQIAPAGVPDVPFSCVRQGPTEPFSSFIDRLSQAVDRQVTIDEAKRPLMESLAFGNANQDCQRVISAMPGWPSLAEMVEACSRVGTPQYVASIVRDELRGEWEEQIRRNPERQSEDKDKVVEKMLEKVLQQQNENINKVLATIQKKNNPSGGQCYKCGAFGHLKKNCPHAHPQVQTQKPAKPLCARCGRGRHSVKECYSQTDVEGNPLPYLGNGRRSAPANCQCASTQVMAVTQQQTEQSSGNVKQTPSANSSVDSQATQTSFHQEHSAH